MKNNKKTALLLMLSKVVNSNEKDKESYHIGCPIVENSSIKFITLDEVRSLDEINDLMENEEMIRQGIEFLSTNLVMQKQKQEAIEFFKNAKFVNR